MFTDRISEIIPMKILRIAQDVFPDTVGGAPYHIHALSRDQAARGHDVTVLTVSENADEQHSKERDGYTLVKQIPKVDLFGNQLFTNTLDYISDAEDYDIIHAHSHLFFSSNVAAMYGRVSDTPLAVTCHGLISQRVPEWLSKAHLRTMGKLTYNAADVSFCYTEAERSVLRDIGVDADIQVISNGVDTERFSPTGEHYDQIEATDGPALLFVGRLVEGKRPQDAIAAMETVRETFPDANLYLCGDGPLMEDLRETVATKRLTDAVTFLGRVPYREMPAVFRAADLFLLPSRTEGFPRTIMEALACETPVISTHLEQTADVVEQTGETVDVCDPDGLATEIMGLVDDPAQLSKLGRRGRQIVLEEYDWSETVEKTTQTLRQLAAVQEVPATESTPRREEGLLVSQDGSSEVQ
jgi:glycosyltransferase involved in cell wall biosynthesis